MFQTISLIILIAYLGLIYRFRKNDILLLLTLIAILILCNLKNFEGQSPYGNSTNNAGNNTGKVANNNNTGKAANNNNTGKAANNNNTGKDANNNNTGKAANNNTGKAANNNTGKASNNNTGKAAKNSSNNGPRGFENYMFKVATSYQMGPYDGLSLKLPNPDSEYVVQKNVSLADKEDMCVYQGHDTPLKCDKALYSGMGPSITGVADDDQNLFMLYRNKSSPDCCPSTFSTSTGCVCTTDDQRNYINRRGMVSSK